MPKDSCGTKCCNCMCNRKLTKTFLYTINITLLVMGILLTAVSSWGVKYDSNLRTAVPPAGVVPILIAGIFFMVLAVLGFMGGCFNHARCGQWFLVIFAMFTLGALLCELISSSVLLEALGKFHTPWTNAIANDTIAKWVESTWTDCCYFTNGTQRTVYTCWTATHSNCVTTSTCGNEPLFYNVFMGWMRDHLTPAAAIALTLFLLQFVVIVSAFCAFSHGRKRFKYKEAKETADDEDIGEHNQFHDDEGGHDQDEDPEAAIELPTKLKSKRTHFARSTPPPAYTDTAGIDVSIDRDTDGDGDVDGKFGVGQDSDDDDNNAGTLTQQTRSSGRRVGGGRRNRRRSKQALGSDADSNADI